MPVQVTDVITPTAVEDVFATHDEQYGKGGYRTVATLAARDLITTQRRSEGMLVHVVEDGVTYQLAANLTSWVEYKAVPTVDAVSKAFTQGSHTFVVGDAIFHNGTNWVKGQANAGPTAEVDGVVTEVIGANDFVLTFAGYSAAFSGLTPGSTYFLSAATAGALVTTEPAISLPVLKAISATEALISVKRGFVL